MELQDSDFALHVRAAQKPQKLTVAGQSIIFLLSWFRNVSSMVGRSAYFWRERKKALTLLKAGSMSAGIPHSAASSLNGFSQSFPGGFNSAGTACVFRRANVSETACRAFPSERDPEWMSKSMSTRSRTLLFGIAGRGNVYAWSFSANCCSVEIIMAVAGGIFAKLSQSRHYAVSTGSITTSPIPISRWNRANVRPPSTTSTGYLAPP